MADRDGVGNGGQRTDARRLTATSEGILLTAWTAAELARDIRWEEQPP